MYDAQPNEWVSNIKYVFAMIESKSKQIIPNMNWTGRNGRTRANVSQTSLAIDSGATVHFFSNSELLQSIKTIKTAKIYCGGTSFDQCEPGLLRRELRHLPFPRKKIFLAKDEIANLVSLGKLVKEGFRVTMDSDVENAINIYNEDGSYIKFHMFRMGCTVLTLMVMEVILIPLLKFLNRRNTSLMLIIRRLP